MAEERQAGPPEVVGIPWQPQHDKLLAVSAGADLEMIREQVQQGTAQLWQCTAGPKRAFVVTRIDRVGDGLELCLVLGEGSGFKEFAPIFVTVAKRKGYGFRTHVKRRGLIRMWSRFGVDVDEYVLRVNHGQ